MAGRLGQAVVAGALAVGLITSGTAARPAGVRAADGPWTALVVDPLPNDWVSGGRPATLLAPDVPISAERATASRFTFAAGTETDRWVLEVWTTPGGFTAGTTYDVGPDTGQNAWLSLSRNSSGCTPYGTVTVEEYAIDAASSTLVAAALTLALNCSGIAAPPTLFVEVRFQSSIPWATASVTPGSLDFGTDPVGGAAISREVTLASTGVGPLVITSLGVEGRDAADFTVGTGSCQLGDAAAVPVGATCTVEVRYNARSGVQYRAAALRIGLATAKGGISVPLTGLDTWPWQLDPSTVSFGSVGALATAVRTVTLRYDGDGEMVPTALEIHPVDTLSYRADFAVTGGTCVGSVVPTGGSCTIEITFAPTEEGDNLAGLRLRGASPIPSDGFSIGTLTGSGTSYEVPAVFDPHRVASPGDSWNHGRALGRTATSGGTQWLHLVSMTDRVGGKAVANRGPYMPVNYQRSTGSTWSSAKRLNGTTAHGYWASLAATGSAVHVTWVQSARIYNVSPTAPRVVWYRRNTAHGTSNAWWTAKRLSSSTGRTDMPSVAASGSRVLVAWTDSATGAIRIARSTDSGATFRTTSAGTTARTTAIGRSALPKVAISGNTAIVAWLSNRANAIVARISTNGGRTWSSARTIARSSTSIPSVAAGSGRAAVAFSSWGRVLLGLWKGTWQAGVREPGPSATLQYGPEVVLRGTSGIAVATSACMEDCDAFDAGTRVDLWWHESPDGGLHWGWTAPAQSLETDDTTISDSPSIAWGDQRVVAWNAWSMTSTYSRIHVATGVDRAPGAQTPLVAAPLLPPPGDPAVDGPSCVPEPAGAISLPRLDAGC